MLDWEKAFDKIDHAKMWIALDEIGIPKQILDAIKGLYAQPEFRVKEEGAVSDWLRQDTGIRKGCPLSPYLFIIVTSVMFHRIRIRDKHRTYTDTPEIANYQEVLYADDTILISKSSASMNKYLRLVEVESKNLV